MLHQQVITGCLQRQDFEAGGFENSVTGCVKLRFGQPLYVKNFTTLKMNHKQ
jgi:hypothetical protein